MTWAKLCLDTYHPALFAAHFSHFGLLCFRIDQDLGFMPKTRGEFLNRLKSAQKLLAIYSFALSLTGEVPIAFASSAGRADGLHERLHLLKLQPCNSQIFSHLIILLA